MNEVEALLKLLSAGCAHRTFLSLTDELSNLRKSIHKSEKKDFRLAVCLAILLGDQFNVAQTHNYESAAVLEAEADIVRDGILSPAGRLAALYLIHHLYRDADRVLSQNPFLPFFVEIIDSPPSSSLTLEIEADFLTQLLWKTPSDLSKVTPSHVIRTYRPRASNQRPDISPIRKLWEDRQPVELTPLPCHGLRRVLRDSSKRTLSKRESTVVFDFEKEFNLQAFEPEFVRPSPELLPVTEHELRWLDIEDRKEICLEEEDCQKLKRVSELMQTATNSTLSHQQEEELLQWLKSNAAQKLMDVEFSSQKLPELIRHNPKVVTNIFLALNHTSQVNEYYKILVQIDLEKHHLVHSMQIVGDITSMASVPSGFLHHYIKHCIRSIGEIQETFFQKQVVRQFCGLIQTLIRTKMININDLYSEIQTFCILFSLVKEATALSRLIMTKVKEPETTQMKR